MAEAWYVIQRLGPDLRIQLRALGGGWTVLYNALPSQRTLVGGYAPVQYKTKHRAACVANKLNMQRFERRWAAANPVYVDMAKPLSQEELDILLVSVALTEGLA